MFLRKLFSGNGRQKEVPERGSRSLDEIPDEVCIAIFVYLPAKSLGRLACTATRYRRLAQDNYLWRCRWVTDFGAPHTSTNVPTKLLKKAVEANKLVVISVEYLSCSPLSTSVCPVSFKIGTNNSPGYRT